MTRTAFTPPIRRASLSANATAFRLAASPPFATARASDSWASISSRRSIAGKASALNFGGLLWTIFGDRVIGLDGVVAQQENYRKSGFRLAFRNIRQQGRGGGAASSGLTDLAAIPIEEILRYDETAFPAPRAEFLKSWIGQPQAVALGVVDGRRLKGYGVLRASREGFKIGPLFADDEEIAERLFVRPAGSRAWRGCIP